MQALANTEARPIHHDGLLFPNSGLFPVLISLGQRERLFLSSIHLFTVTDQQHSEHRDCVNIIHTVLQRRFHSGYAAVW